MTRRLHSSSSNREYRQQTLTSVYIVQNEYNSQLTSNGTNIVLAQLTYITALGALFFGGHLKGDSILLTLMPTPPSPS